MFNTMTLEKSDVFWTSAVLYLGINAAVFPSVTKCYSNCLEQVKPCKFCRYQRLGGAKAFPGPPIGGGGGGSCKLGFRLCLTVLNLLKIILVTESLLKFPLL